MREGGNGGYVQINKAKIDIRLQEYCSDNRVTGFNVDAMDRLTEIKVRTARIDRVQVEEKTANDFEAIMEEYVREVEETNCTPAEFFKERSIVSKKHKITMYRYFD